MVHYAATTAEVTVSVRPVYLDHQSDPLRHQFVFAYFIEVTNLGDADVQLLRRQWLITDGHGQVKEVEGPGVVGQQPVIGPRETHRYSSFCVLETMEGTMEGSYLMERARGERFRATIPRFHLRASAN